MNRFEGLRLPELMDLLHEIVEPPAVAWLPQTPGWWVLGAWIFAVLVIAVRHWLAVRRRNRYRRDALHELDQLAAGAESTAAEIALLVKRTALAAYPREQVASLYGADWAAFLRRSAGNDPVVAAGAESLASAAYRADAHGQTLVEPARRWIRVHRA
jgi:hypothetical protein